VIVLLACFPKSGSTYLADLISLCPGFRRGDFVPAYGRREQEICATRIERFVGVDCVAQHHVRASERTLELTEQYQIQTLVLVRNLADALVSLSNHIVRESPVMPHAYFDTDFQEMSEARRMDAVVDLAAPWFFNFYVSWWRSRPEAIITYEETVLGGDFGIVKSRLGLSEDPVGSPNPRRFNVGISGRGAQLGRSRLARLSRMASHYADVDFSPIGL
jgi:hypothetical protein